MKTGDSREAGFDATEVRDALRFAMNMGLPEEESQRATFRWTTKKTFGMADSSGRPYSWGDAPTSIVTQPDVQVACAVEFVDRFGQPTSVGTIDAARGVITMLDEEYEEVIGADQVILGENTYFVQFVAPQLGLFDLTVYQIYIQAVDES